VSLSREIADDWWARDFGCAGSELRPTRTHVQRHAGLLLGDPGVWFLVAGGAPLVSLPADASDALVSAAQSWSATDVAGADNLQRQLSALCTRPWGKTIGPAFIGYGSALSLDLRDAGLAQPISSNEAIEGLRLACEAEEWERRLRVASGANVWRHLERWRPAEPRWIRGLEWRDRAPLHRHAPWPPRARLRSGGHRARRQACARRRAASPVQDPRAQRARHERGEAPSVLSP
jgi:hypothetical protein